MAVNHTPPSRSTTQGPVLAGANNQLETAIRNWLNVMGTVVQAIDGGEPNATDEAKMAGVQAEFGFKISGALSNAAAVAAIGQLQAIRSVLTGGQAALDQAFARLRG